MVTPWASMPLMGFLGRLARGAMVRCADQWAARPSADGLAQARVALSHERKGTVVRKRRLERLVACSPAV